MLASLSSFAADRVPADGNKMIEAAVERMNIFDLSSVRMAANIRVRNRGKTLEGTYELLWNGPDQWREEIKLPGYSEIEVGDKNNVWIKRTTDFLPLSISWLHNTLGFGSGLGARASLVRASVQRGEIIKKAEWRKINGIRCQCFEIVDQEEKSTREICISETTNTLVRTGPYKDEDLQPIGNKFFPLVVDFEGGSGRSAHHGAHGWGEAGSRLIPSPRGQHHPTRVHESRSPAARSPSLATLPRARKAVPYPRDGCHQRNHRQGRRPAWVADRFEREFILGPGHHGCVAELALRTGNLRQPACRYRHRCDHHIHTGPLTSIKLLQVVSPS